MSASPIVPGPPRNLPQDKGKTIIMCFDGTGYKPGKNSNVVRFFRAIKDCPTQQIKYYQPGVGTYNKYTGITGSISAGFDLAIAWHLDDHVKEGYTYLVQNYQRGDRICLFGFSRGAHTARVLAGMIYKVGILQKDNLQQINFAFNIFKTDGYHGFKLCQEFKTTFAIGADVEFVGVWDTVSAVGVLSHANPAYASINYSAKHVRHALALDEKRARFRPDMWCEPLPGREHELDIDFPIDEHGGSKVKRDNWRYTPPDRDYADVKEVWFAGAHADVGGDSKRHNQSLQLIPLRWMIKECILARIGIQFDMKYLSDYLYFDFDALLSEASETIDLGSAGQELERYAKEPPVQDLKDLEKVFPSKIASSSPSFVQGVHEAYVMTFNPLAVLLWMILEFIPFLTYYQDREENWIRLRICNLGNGRFIPFHKGQILVHKSVKDRIAANIGYTPKAYNWIDVKSMCEYVS